ncbi:MAG: hypothetical protein ABIR56_14265 [Polaromonas sp.]
MLVIRTSADNRPHLVKAVATGTSTGQPGATQQGPPTGTSSGSRPHTVKVVAGVGMASCWSSAPAQAAPGQDRGHRHRAGNSLFREFGA